MVLATATKALSTDANDLVRVLQSGCCASCCLADADLSDADMQGAEPQRANLGQAFLDGADLKGADLSFNILNGASLRGDDLRGSRLYGTDLRNSDLSGARLKPGSLEQSHWQGGSRRGFAATNEHKRKRTPSRMRSRLSSDERSPSVRLVKVAAPFASTVQIEPPVRQHRDHAFAESLV